MISDTLSDAIDQIKQYEAEYPEAYGDPGLKGRIAAVVSSMDQLRRELDCPPTDAPE